MSSQFLKAIATRRTSYALTNRSSIPDEKIHEIVKQAVLHTPTSFNSQSVRAVVLLKEQHTKLWNIAIETLKAIVPAEAFPATQTRLQGFQAGYGTVLYFTDDSSVRALQEKLPLYKDRFPTWADHSQGITQEIVWTAFALEGLGASLQHYNPLIDERVRAEWGISPDWQLIAQAPFGVPVEGWVADEKAFEDINARVKYFD